MGASGHISQFFLQFQNLVVLQLHFVLMLLLHLFLLIPEMIEIGDKLGILLEPPHNLLLVSLDCPVITEPNLIQTLLQMHQMPVHLLSGVLIWLLSGVLLGAADI